MVSRFLDLERKSVLVQFIAVEPLTFHSTSDGTDLVQDILRSQLSRSDRDIFGQEGTLSVDDQGEFLAFEPADTKNRALHLPIEHLAYCGALRRMRQDSSDQRNPDQIHRREFENVDLANRFAHYIIGPPIFVAVFHGFDNALCYTFVTQSADDACLVVMKLMRAFKLHEQQQGQANQGYSSFPPTADVSRAPSPFGIKQGSPLRQSTQANFADHRQNLSTPTHLQPSHSYVQDFQQDELIQRLLANPNLQLVNPRPDDPSMMSGQTSMNQRSSPIIMNNSVNPSSSFPLMGRSTSQTMRPPSPPILGVPPMSNPQNLSLSGTNPQVVYKPNNQEVVYKQNIMVRWLQPPTPPPPAPIIIREVQGPTQVEPPIVCRQMPPCPPTPPPIIVREKPPPCPPPGQPLIIEKRMPPMCLPRQVIVERYPAPLAKPPTIIYEKYLPTAPPPRQVIVKREICRPTGYPLMQQQGPTRHLVREIIRQIPQTAQPAFVCVPQQQQQQFQPPQQQTVQQFMPVFASRQHIVQPKGVRIIRQVIGPTQGALQQPQQIFSSSGTPMVQTVPANFIQ